MNPNITNLRREILASDIYDKSWMVPNDIYGWYISLKIFIPFIATLVLTPIAYDALLETNIAWLVPLISFILVGVFAYKFSFVLHDTCHYTLFRSKKLNEWVGTIAGYFAGTNFEIYKFIHMQHHKWNGELEDPQIDDCLNRNPRRTKKELVIHLIEPLLFGRFLSFISHYFTFLPDRFKTHYPYQDDPEMPKSGLGFYIGVFLSQVLVAALMSGFLKHPFFIFIYPVAAIIISLFLARIRAVVEHTRTNEILAKDFTRSHKYNLIEEFMLYEANFNFHFEHHVFPQMPAYHLPKMNSVFFKNLHPDQDTFSDSMFATIARCYKSFD